MFMECQRCFYLDNKLGIARPRGPSFTLNTAVDTLLKKEFDTHRINKTPHPLMVEYAIDAVPFLHNDLGIWRENFQGIQYFHQPTGLTVSGAIDDVWVNSKGELIVVDYKSTSKEERPSSIDDLYPSYKRQMEVYQWLFRQNGFVVLPTSYFIYVNGKTDASAFEGKLEFDTVLIPYVGDDTWILSTLEEIKKVLETDAIPPVGISFGGGSCDYCTYREAAGRALLHTHREQKTKTE